MAKSRTGSRVLLADTAGRLRRKHVNEAGASPDLARWSRALPIALPALCHRQVAIALEVAKGLVIYANHREAVHRQR